MNGRWNHSVAFRFTLLTFLLVITISILFIVVEGYRSYRREVARLNVQIAQIEESHIPSIVSSLWLTDYDLLNRQLRAIERFPYIDGVVVRNDEGELFQTGERVYPGSPERTRTLTYTRRDNEIEIGTLGLYVDARELRASALRSEILSALGHLALALLTAATVALLFHRQVGRHIENIAVHAQKSTEPEFDEPFRLDRKRAYDDELHGLVDAIDTMRRSLVGRVQERELLMRELHHRIKSLEEVDLSLVVRDVARDLQTKGALSAAALETETESVIVPVRISVAFGIIANELLTNAAKYSDSSGAGACIKATLGQAQPPSMAELVVRDDGKGFPQDVLNGEHLGYGLTIIKALVEQHGGTISMRNDPGATVVVRI